MDAMIRKQIYIKARQEALLKRLARERGLTESQIIREAIDLREHAPSLRPGNLTAWENEKAFIAELMKTAPAKSGRAERAWRREDLHER